MIQEKGVKKEIKDGQESEIQVNQDFQARNKYCAINKLFVEIKKQDENYGLQKFGVWCMNVA